MSLGTAILFASCGDSTPANSEKSAAEMPADNTTTAPEAGEVTLHISGDDNMKFDKTELRAKEGQQVKIVLKHTGKAPLTAMGHNIVILAQGTDVAAFTTQAIEAKDNDYIPKSMEQNVIAHTKMIGGGEAAEVVFTAPAKGSYDFLCSFPGHAALMKGKFVVE